MEIPVNTARVVEGHNTMKRNSKFYFRISAVVLVLLLALSMLPTMAMAESSGGGGQLTSEDPVPTEDTEDSMPIEDTEDSMPTEAPVPIETLGDETIQTLDSAVADATVSFYTAGNIAFTAVTGGFEYDYLNNYQFMTRVLITPKTAGTITLTAPVGLRFFAPAALPAGIEAYSFATVGGNQGTITLTLAAPSGSAISINIDIPTGAYNQNNFSDNLQAQKDYIGVAVGGAVETQYLADGSRAELVVSVKDGADVDITESTLIPKEYATVDLFSKFVFLAQDNWYTYTPPSEATTANDRSFRVTKWGQIGSYPGSGGFRDNTAGGHAFALENEKDHEPVWGLAVKIYLPDGITVAAVSGAPTITTDTTGRYIALDQDTNPAAFNLTRLLAPQYGKSAGTASANSMLFTKLYLIPAETLVPKKEYEFVIKVNYETTDGAHAQEFKYPLYTDDFNPADKYVFRYINHGDPTMHRGAYSTTLDMPQGWDGNTFEIEEYINIWGNTAGTDLNEPHKNGFVQVDTVPTDYEIYKATLAKATSAVYYMQGDSLTGSGRPATKDGTTFTFTDAVSSGAIARIVFKFDDGIDLQDGASTNLSFGLRTNTFTDAVKESTIKLSLLDKNGAVCKDSLGAEITDHVKELPVYLRKPLDTLRIGTADYTGAPHFLSGGVGNHDPVVNLTFGYANLDAGQMDRKGEWMTYDNIDIAIHDSARALEVLDGKVTVSATISTTGAKIHYTTNLNSTERSVDIPDGGTFKLMSVGAARSAQISLAADEYITGLRFTATKFMVTYARAGNVGYWWNYYTPSPRISFSARDSRVFPSDGRDIPNYNDQDKANTSYPVNATYKATQISAEREAVPDTNQPVRFQTTMIGTVFSDPNYSFIYPGSGTSGVAAGDVFEVSFNQNYPWNPGYNPNGRPAVQLNERLLWVKLNVGYYYAGNDPNVRVTENSGSTYLIIGENTPLDVTTGLYKVKLSSLPTFAPGPASPIANAWWDVSGTVLNERNASTPPYVVAERTPGNYYENYRIVDDPTDIDGDGILSEYLTPLNNTGIQILERKQYGVRVIPGYGNTYADPKIGVEYHDSYKDSLIAGVVIETAENIAKNYTTVIHLPRQGEALTFLDENGNSDTATAEYDMTLKSAIDKSMFGAVQGAVVSYTKDGGGAWVEETNTTTWTLSDWEAVTDIKIFFAEFPKMTSVLAKLSLSAANATLAGDEISYITAAYISQGIPEAYSNAGKYHYWPEFVDVHFYPNYGANAEYSSYRITDAPFNSLINAPVPAPTRAEYTFDGWYTTPQTEKAWVFDTDKVKDTTNLYAKWTPNRYTVLYAPGADAVSGLPANADVSYDTSYTVSGQVPTRPGYTFLHWSSTLGPNYTSGSAFTMPASNVTLTAVWQLNTVPPEPPQYVTVTFVNGFGTTLSVQQVLVGGSATAPGNPTAEGYTFIGWDQGYTNIRTNITVTALWTSVTVPPPPEYITVTFVNGFGTTLSVQQVLVGGSATAPGNPTVAGYTFTGWDRGYANVRTNITVTALWTSVTVPPPTAPDENETELIVTSDENETELNATQDENETELVAEPEEPEASNPILEAARNAGIPIGPGNVPLFGPKGFAVWALLNLILTIIGIVVVACFVIVLYRRKKKYDDDDKEEAKYQKELARRYTGSGHEEFEPENEEDEHRKRTRKGWIVVTIVAAIAGAVLFLFTEDMRLPMVFLDVWTIFNAIILAIEIIAYKLALKKPTEYKEHEEANAVANA
ncbi:hypothetical protein AGMMS49983_01990 [Clostridia bacterium]|nr:hypothetical protein AGMMS49983_01990 [Clostridia bacterium]